MFIYPYKSGSKTVNILKDALGAKKIKLEGSNFKGSGDKVVINWGNSTPNAEVEKCILLNTPERIKEVSNKLNFFNMAKERCRIPEFTTEKVVALSWVEQGKAVVVREKLTGYGGEGIVLIEDLFQFEEYNHSRAKLYVKYIPKKQEYRVHVVGDEVVMVQRKARNTNVPDQLINWKIRNHDNGFVFAKNEDHTPHPDVLYQSQLAIKAAGLDFGAVDVVFNEYKEEAYVLEINSAPGLEGTSVDTYIEALKAYAHMLGEEEKQGKPTRKRKGKPAYWLDEDQPAPGVQFDQVNLIT